MKPIDYTRDSIFSVNFVLGVSLPSVLALYPKKGPVRSCTSTHRSSALYCRRALQEHLRVEEGVEDAEDEGDPTLHHPAPPSGKAPTCPAALRPVPTPTQQTAPSSAYHCWCC
ncbi:hypothetical protein AAFF_G00401920 [Aldrovandia affinis]|uniref:Uncharacterized protein n=1 Tax=Aldrovandia affinis TaxID=143900 RepID=A0AAD7VYQ6_9TELE|nr:hypothetical protein AAFF_G00401920 [Aldrovandia affinis]